MKFHWCQQQLSGPEITAKMEPVSILFKQSIPHYFENLPIPNTFGGWFKLGCTYQLETRHIFSIYMTGHLFCRCYPCFSGETLLEIPVR